MKIARIISPFAQRKNFILGIIFGVLSVFIAVSLLSYNPEDPSFNNAVDYMASNLAGVYGAYIADPFIQLFGVAAIMLVIIPFNWSVNLIVKKHISYWWMRVSMLLLTLVSLLNTVAVCEMYFAKKLYISGMVGEILKTHLLSKIPFAYQVATATVTLVVAVIAFVLASGYSKEEWKKHWQMLIFIIRYIYKIIKILLMIILYPFRRVKQSQKNNQDQMVETGFKAKIKKELKAPVRKKMLKTINKPDQEIESIYSLPPMNLLNPVSEKNRKAQLSESSLAANAARLESVLQDFGVQGKITDIHQGPVVTLYELEPAAGTKSSRIIGIADDIARSMSAISARIAVVPGRNAIGIELPNLSREIIYLRELLESPEYHKGDFKLPLVLGKDIAGKAIMGDLTKMPHLLVAGTTGSGKSVAINTMILSLLYKLTPEQCRFIMIDPKMLELSVYEGIPHLLTPVVTEPRKAVIALKWVVKEMENRYRMMSSLGVRNIVTYNNALIEAKAKGEKLERSVQTGFDPSTGRPIIEKMPIAMDPLPFIVVIVDEMADLMLVAGKDIETSVQRLSQMARAAGIHIIMATQRPSVDVITGVIKANFPTRISFQVTSRIDSRTILGEQGGAEQLLGMGDMLYMAGGSRITRVHGPFVDDKEVEKIVSYLQTQGEPNYVEDITVDQENSDENGFMDEGGDSEDDIYNRAVAIVARERKASTSYIQRCLKIGYNRAANIIERMEKEGIVSQANHVGKREVLIGEK